jgi:YfiH family protein
LNDGGVITPEWPVPSRVKAFITTRRGGVSLAPFNDFNLALHVGDVEQAVNANRLDLAAFGIPSSIQWLEQIHGVDVLDIAQSTSTQKADALTTRSHNLVCAILTADCLPVFFANTTGTRVAVAHAGWRGLAAGILERTAAFFDAADGEILAYLGPAISRQHFEVGEEVKQAFLQSSSSTHIRSAIEKSFSPSRRGAQHYYADLYQLARIKLHAVGIEKVFGGSYCTYEQAELFYSYRRDGQTGRMGSLIYLAD